MSIRISGPGRFLRVWFAFVGMPVLALALTPAEEIGRALAHFRTEGPPGWAYTQVSSGEGKDQIESYDPMLRPPLCWTLLEIDHHPPSPKEQLNYRELKSQRSSEFNAPRIENELNLATCRVLENDATLLKAAFGLKNDQDTEQASHHLEVEVTLHRPTETIEQVEILNRAPFSPVIPVRIDHMHTVIRYSLPHDGIPSLLMKVTISLQGKLFWLKTLDQHLDIERKDYRYAAKRPVKAG